jgi:hypothetical protein
MERCCRHCRSGGAGDKKVAERRHSAIGAVRPVVEEHGFPALRVRFSRHDLMGGRGQEGANFRYRRTTNAAPGTPDPSDTERWDVTNLTLLAPQPARAQPSPELVPLPACLNQSSICVVQWTWSSRLAFGKRSARAGIRRPMLPLWGGPLPLTPSASFVSSLQPSQRRIRGS